MGVPPSTIGNIDRLPDYLLNSGLEILSDLAAFHQLRRRRLVRHLWPRTFPPLSFLDPLVVA
jgi:hypothetical protein